MRKTTKLLGAIFGILWALPVWGADCITDSDNIFLSDGATVGFYSQDGSYTAQHANMMTTNFLNIPDSAVTLTYSFDGEIMSAPCIVFFDNAQQPIYFYPMGGQNTVSITIPDETKYVKIPYRTTFTTQTVTYTYDRCLGMPIKIATTKYNETAFGPLNTALQNAISVVDSVVSNTITQAGRIATLQAQKQTRPNDIADDSEKCPAGKKCLLVEDASGVPHWYEIVENAWDLPVGYTQLQWIESTGTQYLDLDTGTQTGVFKIIADVYAAGSTDWQYLFGYAKDGGGSPLGVWVSKNQIKETFVSGNGNVIADVNKWEHIDITNSKTVTISDFYIFHVNPTGVTSYTINPGRIKYLQLKKDGDTIRNMIPVKRNSDGVLGMFDTVNDVFYTNAGDGEFVAGPVAE